MSDETTTPQKITYPVIPHDAIVTVEFSGYFINRIQNLLIGHCTALGKDESLVAFEQAKALQPCETIEKETVAILLCLVESIEDYALEQKKVENIQLTPEEFAAVAERISIPPSAPPATT